MRDDKDKVETAFARSVRDVTVLVAECRAIHEVVKLARNSKIQNMEVESDAIQVI